VKKLVKVMVRDNRNIDKYINIVRKKGQLELLPKKMKEKQAYEKPTWKKKRKKLEAKSRERKRQRKMRLIIGF
jgi:small subunit ribosomal protein S21